MITNNNRVDLAGEGLDLAIRFGDGAWHGTSAEAIMDAPLTPVCSPVVADRLTGISALAGETLLRSYRADEWPLWFEVAGEVCPALRGPVFDSSMLMAGAAAAGLGVALVPAAMFTHELASEWLVRPFSVEVSTGAYWLTRLNSRRETGAMRSFADWLGEAAKLLNLG